MAKILRVFILFLFVIFSSPETVFGQVSSVSVVNPIRGNDFWELVDQKVETAVIGQKNILKQNNVSATWLIRFDVLDNQEIASLLSSDEKGLFLEITPSWTKAAGVSYRDSGSWHAAGSAFLTGYLQDERIKLIDTAFEKFKEKYGVSPKSVGAWYIDSFSLDYMQKKYGILGALIVSDQYTTDNYQIWGQYWSYPYYPDKQNTLIPAQNVDSKIPVVIVQWAPRDPLNGYGDGVQESTYSVQANDYIDYHKLDIKYFTKLVDILTKQKLNSLNQIVVGLENSYVWNDYQTEYKNQIETLSKKQKNGELIIQTMEEFSSFYQNKFPDISPTNIIIADDPLGTDKKVVWFMNPYYRAGWFYAGGESVFRDIRQYIANQKEPCFDISCDQLNFATFATRVLDDVTNKQRLVLDKGRIYDFSVNKSNGNFLITYKNEADKKREIKLMERDISIDGNAKTIDGIILDAGSSSAIDEKQQIQTDPDLFKKYRETPLSFFLKATKFIAFTILALLIPGYIFIKKIEVSLKIKIFLSITLGFVIINLTSFVLGYLRTLYLLPIIILASILYFIYKKYYKDFKFEKSNLNKFNFIVAALIFSGIVFQSLGLVKSGWVYDFGIGFFGPTAHDMVWHQSLINQLAQNVPPNNPIFSGNVLNNYHYFYDLLVANTQRLSQISSSDLSYRFYPVLFSLLLGIGSLIITTSIFKERLVSLFSLYFIYFGSSFGWIVEFIRERHFGGESAFWTNQPVSMNLNPPFAISLLIFITGLVLLKEIVKKNSILLMLILIITWGSLIEYKVYGGVLVLGTLLIVSLMQLARRNIIPLILFLGTLVISLIVFLPQNSSSSELLVLSPFWFVHSMIDFNDRVGWMRLAQARGAYLERGEWFKLILAEGLALVIFIGGNLGTRAISIFAVGSLIKSKFLGNVFYCFIFIFSVLSLVIPLIFIQKGNPWNTIQFTYYFLYIMALFSGVGLTIIYKFLPKFISLAVVIVVLFITPISSYATFTSYFGSSPPAALSLAEYDALNFLKNQKEGVVLTHPYDKNLRSKYSAPYPIPVYETTAYVSAYSAKVTFLEDEFQHEIFQTDYTKRIVQSNEFFKGSDTTWSKQFFRQNSIKYIYLPKLFNVKLNSGNLGLKTIFNNNEVEIYEVEYI